MCQSVAVSPSTVTVNHICTTIRRCLNIRQLSPAPTSGSDQLQRETSEAEQRNRSWNDFPGPLYCFHVAADRIAWLSQKVNRGIYLPPETVGYPAQSHDWIRTLIGAFIPYAISSISSCSNWYSRTTMIGDRIGESSLLFFFFLLFAFTLVS